MSKYAFGVDVGGTTVKLGLFNDEGQVLDKWEIPTVKDNGGEKVLPDIAASIKNKNYSNPKIMRKDLEKLLNQQWLHFDILKEIENADNETGAC